MGAKYLKVVKRGLHPNNGWSLDEIRVSQFAFINYWATRLISEEGQLCNAQPEDGASLRL